MRAAVLAKLRASPSTEAVYGMADPAIPSFAARDADLAWGLGGCLA